MIIFVTCYCLANHPMMLKIQNMQFQNFRYFDESTGLLDFTGMMADLASIPEGSVVLLHAWCVKRLLLSDT
jgi:aspartate/tyrosine/aromatic aminotransferase